METSCMKSIVYTVVCSMLLQCENVHYISFSIYNEKLILWSNR